MGVTAEAVRTPRWSGARIGTAARRPLRWRWGAAGLVPPVSLAAATVAFCWKLLIAGLVVIGYDTMTYMYPYRYFAAQSLRDGRLPLWNPYIYFGAPFLANLQSAVFYPLHAIFLVLPATQAMNWSVALHLFLAAYFTYLAGRVVVGLGPTSATVAGAIYGLGGFVGAQVGHLNQLNAAAWLPAALTTLHLAIARRDRRWIAATALVLGVQLLAGHAQETYMTVVLLTAYAAFYVGWGTWSGWVTARAEARTLAEGNGHVPRSPAARVAGMAIRDALWAFGGLGIAGGLAGGLTAVQLLPTNELTGLSVRAGGMPIWEASSFSLPPRELFVGLLPSFGLATPSSNEYLGWVGISGLALALVGLLFRVHRPGTLFFALVLMLSSLLALGNHFPLYEQVFRVPGMSLFRVPARWMMLTTLSLALLAASGLSFLRRLGRGGWPVAEDAAGPWRRLAAATRLLLGVLVAGAGAAALWPMQTVGGTGDLNTLPALWLALGAGAVALAFWGLAAAPSRWPGALFTALVLVELFVASRSLEYNNPNPASVYTESRPVIDALRSDPAPWRILSVAATGYHPSDAERLVAGYQPILGERGVMATWINTKYKETLNPNLPMVYRLPSVDGYDGGVLPLRRYVEFKRLFVAPEANPPDALLRDQFSDAPSLSVLRLLGVKYVIDDAIGDVTRDGVYYDLAGSAALGPGERVRLDQIAQLPAAGGGASAFGGGPVGPVTTVGIVTALQGAAAVADGAAVARVTLGGDGGALWSGTLIAGSDSAEGAFSAAVRHRQPEALGPAGAAGSATATYLAKLPVEAVTAVQWVEVQSTLTAPGETVRVYGITLTGAGGASWPVTVAGDGALRLVHRSDVKLYRNERAVPRTYVVSQATVAPDAARALEAMARPDYDPARVTVLERDPGPPPPSRTPLRARLRAVRDGVKDWLGILTDPRLGTVTTSQAVPAGAVLTSSGFGLATVTADEPERMVIRTDAQQASVLVVHDTFYPGWTAQIDGQPAPLWRADYLFRGVPIPAGNHEVELRYTSRALERGALLTLVALITTAAVGFLPLPRAWRGPAGPDAHLAVGRGW